MGKLVRDKIPEIIESAGGRPDFRVLAGSELQSALKAKLVEEAEEAHAASDGDLLEELADVHEVIRGILAYMGWSETDLRRVADEKRIARGGFEEGYYLE